MSCDWPKKKMEENCSESDKSSIVDDLAHDYAKYVDVSFEKERQAFDQSLDDLLTKLDEYLGLIDVIRSDTNLCLNRTISSIYEKSLQLHSVFDKIDHLEKFVGIVKSDVAQVEALLDQAESELASKSPVTKLLSSFTRPSFFGPKRNTSQTSSPNTQFAPPVIFKTSDYLDKSAPVSSSSHQPSLSTSDSAAPESSDNPAAEDKEAVEDSSTDHSFEEVSADVEENNTGPDSSANEAVVVKGEE